MTTFKVTECNVIVPYSNYIGEYITYIEQVKKGNIDVELCEFEANCDIAVDGKKVTKAVIVVGRKTTIAHIAKYGINYIDSVGNDKCNDAYRKCKPEERNKIFNAVEDAINEEFKAYIQTEFKDYVLNKIEAEFKEQRQYIASQISELQKMHDFLSNVEM